MKALTCAVLATGLMMVAGGIAYADINPSAPFVTPIGADFLWRYTLSTDAAEVINPLNSAFFTLYDVNGLLPGSETYIPITEAGTATSALVGATPAGISPTDSPVIPNITVSFLGNAASSTDLGVLQFLDTQSLSNTVEGQFAAQATNAVDGSRSFNSSFVTSPAPEPGSLALLGSGMLGMIGMGLRRFRKR